MKILMTQTYKYKNFFGIVNVPKIVAILVQRVTRSVLRVSPKLGLITLTF